MQIELCFCLKFYSIMSMIISIISAISDHTQNPRSRALMCCFFHYTITRIIYLIIEEILWQSDSCIINVLLFSMWGKRKTHRSWKGQTELWEQFLIILIVLLLESTTLGGFREPWMSAPEESLFIQTIKPLKDFRRQIRFILHQLFEAESKTFSVSTSL